MVSTSAAALSARRIDAWRSESSRVRGAAENAPGSTRSSVVTMRVCVRWQAASAATNESAAAACDRVSMVGSSLGEVLLDEPRAQVHVELHERRVADALELM